MRKKFLTWSLLCTCLIIEAQTPIKSRLTGVVEGIPNAPATLDEAYKIAKIKGQGTQHAITLPQGLYEDAKKKIDKIIGQLEANNTKTLTKEEAADEAVKRAASSNSFVAGSSEMQEAMKELQIKLQDEKFAEEFDAKSDKEKELYLKSLVKSHNVKGNPGTIGAATGNEIREFNALANEINTWKQSLMTKFYNKILQEDAKEHKSIDDKQKKALDALPVITSGEYSGPDPKKEKQINNEFFEDHVKLAKAKLDTTAKLWQNYKSEYLIGFANYDTKLAAIDYGYKYNLPEWRSGVAGLQKALLEIGNDLIYCNQKLTINAASWYVKSLDRSTTGTLNKTQTLALLYVSF
ncbi:hypothetical protein DVR12_19550 [Chitinophaga silvatica]|uniref:Uncharacterized protein n=1 Tax=Chitinophaga silvatica TaxID=2282649 RepID=A0A3E1Y732_9BACT|nr:hypothetical protein [Chitinophaga silvatica]RFS20754.1 hypothetical protein DVR12_19550 [Chitinophaga silvatica]